MLREQILEYLEKFGLLSNTHFGFRNKVSTIDALVYCIESIRYYINNNNFITAALLDLSEAVDLINHKILHHKLHELGFSENALNLIESYLSHRLQKTIVNRVESNWIGLYQGVPRGAFLGPLLFNLYINDLNKQIPANTEIIQYADDNIILTYKTDLKIATYNLEQSLKNISEYYKKHRLMLNNSKTEFITFSKKSKLKETKRNNLLIDNYKIPNVKCVKYIGIYLDCIFKLSRRTKTRITQNGYRDKNIISRPFLEQTSLQLLNALVISHLHYSVVFLASSKNNCFITLEKHLSWAVKTCFKRKKYDSSSDLKLKQILPKKFFLEYKVLNYFLNLPVTSFRSSEHYSYRHQIYATASEPKNTASITK